MTRDTTAYDAHKYDYLQEEGDATYRRYQFWYHKSKAVPGFWSVVMTQDNKNPQMIAMCRHGDDASMIVAALNGIRSDWLDAMRSDPTEEAKEEAPHATLP